MDVYEYQRRALLKIGDFGEFSHAGLLPTDYHGAWSDERMQARYSGLAAVGAGDGWGVVRRRGLGGLACASSAVVTRAAAVAARQTHATRRKIAPTSVGKISRR